MVKRRALVKLEKRVEIGIPGGSEFENRVENGKPSRIWESEWEMENRMEVGDPGWKFENFVSSLYAGILKMLVWL